MTGTEKPRMVTPPHLKLDRPFVVYGDALAAALDGEGLTVAGNTSWQPPGDREGVLRYPAGVIRNALDKAAAEQVTEWRATGAEEWTSADAARAGAHGEPDRPHPLSVLFDLAMQSGGRVTVSAGPGDGFDECPVCGAGDCADPFHDALAPALAAVDGWDPESTANALVAAIVQWLDDAATGRRVLGQQWERHCGET